MPPFGPAGDVGLPALPAPSLQPPVTYISPVAPTIWTPGSEFWIGTAVGALAGVLTMSFVMWAVWPNSKRPVVAQVAEERVQPQAATPSRDLPGPAVTDPVPAVEPEPGADGTPESAGAATPEPVAEPIRPKKKAPAVEVWNSAGRSTEHGEVHTEFLSATVKPPLSVDAGGATVVGTKPALVLLVRVSNRSPDRKIMYHPWGDVPTGTGRKAEQASLTDEHGNVYRRLSPPANQRWAGQAEAAPIEPGAFVEDLLVFEKPFPASFEFRLSLPGRCVELDDELRLKWGAADVSR